MTNVVRIFDTTLRDGEQSPGCSMNLAEKIEVARQLERLGVDIMEAGFAIASPGDFASVKAIANTIKNSTVASLARALPKDIDAAAEALKNAKYPRIHTFLATSDIHMQYKLKKTPEEVLETACEMVKYAKRFCSDIEFSAEDASRSNPAFLYQVFEAVIKAGATTINVPDTVGYTSPEEFAALIKGIKENVPSIDKAIISVHCHNDLGLAVANSLAAIKAGARQVECTINGIGERAGNAALEEVVMNLNTRRDLYGIDCGIQTKEIYKSSKLLSSITGVRVQPNKAIVGENAFAHESGIHQHGMLANKETYEIMTPESIGLTENKLVLGKHSGRHAFEDKLKSMGYDLDEAALITAFEDFKVLADKKKDVTDRDIEALICRKVVQIPEAYKLERFVINAGNTITTTSSMRLLTKTGHVLEEVVSSYDGPIDASYKAIDKLVGRKFILEDFVINSVTGGTDAQGEVNVKIRNNDRVYNGHGVSMDIVEASILAYISAINNMLYDQEEKREV
ncbi:2-isopropylmalate synthase [Cellulosilyticum sp. ST5]|uniref:2-isopropylmalate synthase n=1 Tax=Cellulosilyticum lentocellum (strain ATCC 49066 / DSM 5427 / NCIMB 11756 / RHM5) TaxID=642492 RepID=F2JL13_CELLD|nr:MULTISPECIES: 2-isopropylmalate synthase [Cellulosilyticum]ADZ84554.1 2-isopropylmalate synthase [Cellulosilyticum lentocellum DSM 5427]QEH70007.1 2-isopropylmalate synthase [Cellulosilyticum sp. WCF-2]